MTFPPKQFAILGSGICGVTTANLLLNAYPGSEVTIYSDQKADITTFAAGAQFYPIWLGDDLPEGYDTVLRQWFLASKKIFTEHAAQGLPVYHSHCLELLTRQTSPPAYFYDVLDNLAVQKNIRLPRGYSYQYSYDSMMIDPIRYLPVLTQRYKAKGGKIIRRRFHTIDDVLNIRETVIFNCLGMGAKYIFGDPLLQPVKGVCLRMRPIADLHWVVAAAPDFIIAPRGPETYVGASYITEWKTEHATEAEQAYILNNAIKIMETPGTAFSLVPGTIRKEDVFDVRVGFRPVRSQGPRVEKEIIGSKTIIHNYGHGGNGVILSWGTAAYALTLL